MRTARSRSSAEYLLGRPIGSILSLNGASANPGRFIHTDRGRSQSKTALAPTGRLCLRGDAVRMRSGRDAGSCELAPLADIDEAYESLDIVVRKAISGAAKMTKTVAALHEELAAVLAELRCSFDLSVERPRGKTTDLSFSPNVPQPGEALPIAAGYAQRGSRWCESVLGRFAREPCYLVALVDLLRCDLSSLSSAAFFALMRMCE